MASVLKISDAASLALHAMGYLAAKPDGVVSTWEIASALQVSENHLAKVLQRLTKAGLVKSNRGPKGGFSLERPGGEITLLEVFEVIEGPLNDTNCLLDNQVCDGCKCMMGNLMGDINNMVREHLSKTNLDELTDIFGGGL